MKKKSHARYYQNLLHRYLVFKPKLTVLLTRDSDFLHHSERCFAGADSFCSRCAVAERRVNIYMTCYIYMTYVYKYTYTHTYIHTIIHIYIYIYYTYFHAGRMVTFQVLRLCTLILAITIKDTFV